MNNEEQSLDAVLVGDLPQASGTYDALIGIGYKPTTMTDCAYCLERIITQRDEYGLKVMANSILTITENERGCAIRFVTDRRTCMTANIYASLNRAKRVAHSMVLAYHKGNHSFRCAHGEEVA